MDLARRDRRAAEQALSELSLEQQLAVVSETPLGQRARTLELTPQPEQIIPLLPDAELCFLAKAEGLYDASWILEHATPRQLVASLDLDAWKGLTVDSDAIGAWLAALAEAGETPLLRAAHSLDPELLVLHLRERVDVVLTHKDDEWQPPPGAQTLEGQFYLLPKKEGDDLETLRTLLDALFRNDYWLYFRLLQGVVWELPSELEEWALRWRTGRLEDLGFPSWDESMQIYGYLRPEKLAELGEQGDALDVRAFDLPVWISELPTLRDARHALFRAVADLDEEERQSFFYAFIGVANKLAVADRMALAEPETLPKALEKAAGVISLGLEYVASERELPLAEVLRRASLSRLFRVGASLDPSVLHGEVEPRDQSI